jgi:hypothetical protein
MDIHILRDGKQTGPFSEETIQVLLKQGSILINDLAWQPGMPEWLPLHAVLYPAAQPSGPAPERSSHPIPSIPAPPAAPAEAPRTEAPPAATATATTPAGPEPASPRQKAFLTYIGTPFKSDLTKEHAALLVNDAMENPKNAGKLKRWDEERLRLYPDLFAEEIKSKRENRAQHFLEVCETEGAEFFSDVTKAHAQVLVGYLDVRFPNWDKEERSAKYDYFFPAISEKFPQLLKKAGKGRFKYADGPRVAPELVRGPVAVRARPAKSFFGAVVRGVIFGGIVLGLLVAAVKYGRGELQLPFDVAALKGASKSSSASTSETKSSAKPAAPLQNSSSTLQPSTAATGTAASTAVTSLATPPPRPATPAPAPAAPLSPGAPSLASNTPPAAPVSPDMTPADPSANPPPTALPSTVSLFDNTPPPTAPTPAPGPAAAALAPPTATPAPQIVLGRVNKPTVVSLKFGSSTIRQGTPVQVLSVDGALVKIKFGPDVVSIPATNIDLPESASAAPPSPATPPQ